MKRYEKAFVWLCFAILGISLLVGAALSTTSTHEGSTLTFDGQSYAIDRASTIVIQSESEQYVWDDVTTNTHFVTVTIYLLPEQP